MFPAGAPLTYHSYSLWFASPSKSNQPTVVAVISSRVWKLPEDVLTLHPVISGLELTTVAGLESIGAPTLPVSTGVQRAVIISPLLERLEGKRSLVIEVSSMPFTNHA